MRSSFSKEMKIPPYLTLLLTSLIFMSCQPKSSEQVPTPEATSASKKIPSPSKAKEVNRYEFVESEILSHPEDEIGFNHLYMGSLDGFDYVSVRSNKYRIPSDQLELERSFPLTQDAAKWIHMRIHFSRVKYQ
jgi:hypothetical protein